MLNVRKQYLSQFSGQVANTQQILRHGRVNRVSHEKQLLFLDCRLYSDSVDNILLWPVLDTNETQSQEHVLAFNHSLGVCTFVHDINFGDNSDSSNTFWIQLSGHLQTVWRG